MGPFLDPKNGPTPHQTGSGSGPKNGPFLDHFMPLKTTQKQSILGSKIAGCGPPKTPQPRFPAVSGCHGPVQKDVRMSGAKVDDMDHFPM